MGMLPMVYGIKNMAKQFPAKLPEQIFLCFKMGIKGGSAHIGFLNDLLHGDMGKILFRQECSKGLKDSLPGFALSSVHNNLRTFLENCSVANKKGHLYVATDGLFAMILLNNLFGNNYIVLQKQEKARRLYEKEYETVDRLSFKLPIFGF